MPGSQNKDRHHFSSPRMPVKTSGMKASKETAFNKIGCAE